MKGIVVILALLLICGFALFGYLKKLRRGGGCCGEHAAPDKKVKVADRDKSHYPHTTLLTIDGMTCSNCVRRVENALNTLDGVWAVVDLSTKTATVRLKDPVSDATLRRVVREAGYTVLALKES